MERGDVSRLCVIVEELVQIFMSTAAYRCTDAITCRSLVPPKDIIIVLSDPGRPFDPRRRLRTGLRPDRGGGAGIKIVRAWTSFVDYAVQPGLKPSRVAHADTLLRQDLLHPTTKTAERFRPAVLRPRPQSNALGDRGLLHRRFDLVGVAQHIAAAPHGFDVIGAAAGEASFLRSLQMNTSMIFNSGSSMPP